MNNQELLKSCIKEEAELVFDRFSREDAFELGCLLYENSKRYPDPCCFEITVNGLVVFRYFPQGQHPGQRALAQTQTEFGQPDAYVLPAFYGMAYRFLRDPGGPQA